MGGTVTGITVGTGITAASGRMTTVASGGTISSGTISTVLSDFRDEFMRERAMRHAVEGERDAAIRDLASLTASLDAATAENRRLGERLAGVIEMLRDEENDALGEAIWLLEKIEETWNTGAVEPTPEPPQGQTQIATMIEHYFDHQSNEWRIRHV